MYRSLEYARRLPCGAEPILERGTHFRVWAPGRQRVEVVLEGPDRYGSHPLEAEGSGPTAPDGRGGGGKDPGWHGGIVEGVGPGTLYRLRLDDDGPFPDPASRCQPSGPEGPSEVVDPLAFEWTDAGWPGVRLPGQVVYEMHLGTFTPEGTWAAAARRLDLLAEVGVTLLELMPVADFTGDFGWGYDGVDLFAPYHGYGRPDDMRAFVDRAHALGLGVILDVVYNHFGPRGNHLPSFAAAYLSERHVSEWGPSFNFDGPDSAPVRQLVLAAVEHWIREYHLDGFRLDAAQSIVDDSDRHIVAELTARARASAEGRPILVVAEDERQRAIHLASEADGGWGLDALWNDDAHHSAMVALTGRKHSYQSDYLGSAAEMVAAARHGFLYQGQYYPWQRQRRGQPSLGLPPLRLIWYLENHDQVANTERGERLPSMTGPGQLRAMTAFLLLGPGTPMLFQGQEWGATAPFRYFAHHEGGLAAAVRKGRHEFLTQLRTLQDEAVREGLSDPGSREDSFTPCVLDWDERVRPGHARWLALHQDLIRLRREDRTIASGGERGVEAAVLAPQAWLLRWIPPDAADSRLLIVNLGRELDYAPPSEPLLAPPWGMRWSTIWSSEAPVYGGRGTPDVETAAGWVIPGPGAVLLGPVEGGEKT